MEVSRKGIELYDQRSEEDWQSPHGLSLYGDS